MRLTTAINHDTKTRLFSLVPVFLPIPLAILGIAYLYTLIQRPNIPERFKLEDPHRYGFPEWYGVSPKSKSRTSSSSVGKNYELQVEEGGVDEKCDDLKNVLLFIDLPYDSHHIPKAIDTLSQLRQDQQINLTTISPFSKGWNTTRSPGDNLATAGCGVTDYIWRIGRTSGELDGAACGSTTWIEEVVGDIEDYRANVTLLSQPNEMLHRLNQIKEGETGLLAHIAPSADPTLFYPSRRVSRKSITYFPREDTPIMDWPKLPWGKGWSIHRPSRKSPPRPKFGEDPFDRKNKWYKYWHREQVRLSNTLRQAGICLFEGWHEGLFDERVAKAMLSGCVVAGVEPHTESETLRPVMLSVHRPNSHTGALPLPTELSQLVGRSSMEELESKALRGHILARERYTPQVRERRSWDIVKTFDTGGRGYHFPHGFNWDCTAVTKPPWCVQD